MKFSIIKHNKNANYKYCYDAYLNDVWFNELRRSFQLVDDHETADFSILPIVWEHNYEYDTSINDVKFKNIIILDFIEFGAGLWSDKRYQTELYCFFGFQYNSYNNFLEQNKELFNLHNNLNTHLKDKVRVYFKRELSNHLDISKIETKVLPADYTNVFDQYDLCSETDFWKRGLDVLYIWGRSSQDRVRLHGTLYSQMDRFGHAMFSSTEQYEELFIKNKGDHGIVLLNKEPFERVDFRKYQKNSRGVIDLYGAGLKCFRTIESTINSMSFKQDLSFLSHAYPWIHGENCVMFQNKEGSNNLDEYKACDTLWHYIRGPGKNDLYKIYLKSCETNLKYRNVTYLKDYFIKNIESELK
jgi:hypothetical protein